MAQAQHLLRQRSSLGKIHSEKEYLRCRLITILDLRFCQPVYFFSIFIYCLFSIQIQFFNGDVDNPVTNMSEVVERHLFERKILLQLNVYKDNIQINFDADKKNAT